MAAAHAVGSLLGPFEIETGLSILAVVATSVGLPRPSDARCADPALCVVLAKSSAAANATIAVDAQLRDGVDQTVAAVLLGKRVLPHLPAGERAGAVVAGTADLQSALGHGTAQTSAAAPDQVNWFDDHRNRVFVD